VSVDPVRLDPATVALADLAKRISGYNATQPRLALTFDAEDLRRRIQAALDTRLADARALYASGALGGDTDPPVARLYELRLYPLPADYPMLIEPLPWNGRIVERESDRERDEVTVVIREGSRTSRESEARDEGTLRRFDCLAQDAIAYLLGHEGTDLDFTSQLARSA
jgi:hypothetical protein